jgi:hypothetical protein
MSVRKIAGLLMAFGLTIGLIGGGVGAAFTDSATAVANINVGTFGITVSSATTGAVVVNTGTAGSDVHTVTYSCPTIQSSVAGSCALQFTVTNTGSMPLTITVAASSPAAPFTAVAVAAGPTPIAVSGHVDFNGGIAWPVLTDAQLGMSTSVTYTITATA